MKLFKLHTVLLVSMMFTGRVDAQANLSDELVQQVDSIITAAQQSAINQELVNKLFRQTVLEYGNVEPLMTWLMKQRGEVGDARAQTLGEIEIHVAARRGELRRAERVLTKLLKMEGVSGRRLDLRLWQAQLFDALGDISKAKEAYQALTTEELAEAVQQNIRLRLALMGLLEEGEQSKDKTSADALIELASSSDDTGFRNRAANVLAVQNQHAEAIDLFSIEGEGTVRFRNASRVTEWAIRAENRDKAIESAWDAVRSAQLKRDRRYALALLVEAYRLKEQKKGLVALVHAFEKEKKSTETISDEMQLVWVDLLRELERYDDAIALFKESAGEDTGFSVEVRRELLEMEGEAGNQTGMIAAYKELISSDPDQLVWRAGLTRVFLEQGQDKEAAALWNGYVEQLTKGTQLLQVAQSLGELGQDDIATLAVERMIHLKVSNGGEALLFLSDLQRLRGRLSDAESTLNRLWAMKEVSDAVKSELAAAFERVGRHDKAIEVMESIRAERETVAEDLEMRLAWLYSEIGDEDKALQQWLTLWRKINSIPRRRYVEDRLMTVASRLGTLADIAIELEEKLADGEADDREAGLLVRIYSRVNDSVAASEILEEYMTQSGRNEVERLQERGRIYQICNDYWSYEKVIERLIEIDVEGKTEYLRQLALSMLERGKAQQARKVLLRLRDEDDRKDSIGGEFEAGVLSLVGMNREAADAYRRGLATYPDRIESYLLLANLLRDMGETNRAVGMFQYLAENAERDDLFTIAIDGLLNMEASGQVMQWARRITLERLAGREDKNYLYQLLADLSSEVNDKAGQIRAMENSLAVSGTRRLSVLRECMDLSSNIRGGSFYSSSSRSRGNAGNKPFFAFGRRLIGLGELMPPEVFLDLGQAFLADGDTVSAVRTFGMARSLADQRSYARQVAEIFEQSGNRDEALLRYDRLLRTSPSDIALIARVAKLNEQEGHDAAAYRFYLRGFNLLLAQTPLTTFEETTQNTSTFYRGNRDAYQTYSERLLRGVLVTVPNDAIDKLFDEQRELLDQSLSELKQLDAMGRKTNRLIESPLVEKRSAALRRMYFAFDRPASLEDLDLQLMRQFKDDKPMLMDLARERAARGWYDSIERLLQTTNPDATQRHQLATLLGRSVPSNNSSELLSPKEMWQQLLPEWIRNDTEAARKILRRVDRKMGSNVQSRVSISYVVVNGVLVARQSGSDRDVSAWTRLAIALGDQGLALQFARSQLLNLNRYGVSGIRYQFESYRDILPHDSFVDLVKYAANLYQDDDQRTVEYLWLVSNYRDELGTQILSDEDLLKKVEEGNIRLNYQFTFAQAMQTFPSSIRNKALEHVIERIDKKSRPRELLPIAFQHETRVSEETSQLILESISSGIQAASQDNFLRYATYMLPRRGQSLQCEDNKDFALAALELLCDENIRGREPMITQLAEMHKAIILHQTGETESALDIVLKQYDPEHQTTDYYLRAAQQWAYEQMIPKAPQRFLKALDNRAGTAKRSIPQTDRRLVVIRQTKNDELLREAFEQAWKDHADQVKYPQQYERWEQQNGRLAKSIAINERVLKQTRTKSKPPQSTIRSLERRLGELWFIQGHSVNGLKYFKIGDDLDLANFEKQKEARLKPAKTPVATTDSAPTQTDGKPKTQAPAASVPSRRIASSVVRSSATRAVALTTSTAQRSSNSPGSVRRATTSTLKTAVDLNEHDKARHILRELWRAFPPVVETPYGYRVGQKNVNTLYWPADPRTTKAKQPTAESIRTSFDEQRLRRRAGMASLQQPTRRAVRTVPTSVWQVLGSQTFAISEMQRLMRSRTDLELKNISTVAMGVLHAAREERGDKSVLSDLIEKVKNRHAGHIELVQLFSMLEEDPTRLERENLEVVDELLKQLELSQLSMVSQLAWICGKMGQGDRSAALFTHCALLAPSDGVTFPNLIAKMRETVEGDALITLAERMFQVARKDSVSISSILDLRAELLSAEQVHRSSVELFESLDSDISRIPAAQAVRGAHLFSRVADHKQAVKCLRAAILNNGRPPLTVSYASRIPRPKIRLSRADILRMFPPINDGVQDYLSWLTSAATMTGELVKSQQIDEDLVVDVFLVIALRQAELGATEPAATTLAFVDDSTLHKSVSHQHLAIDVMRTAQQFERAYALETSLYQRSQLPAVRFGDLLRDALRIEGDTKALGLMDELLKKSLDEDLMAAATEVVGDDAAGAKRLHELQSQRQVASDEHVSRLVSAGQRAAERKRWSSESSTSTSTPSARTPARSR